MILVQIDPDTISFGDRIEFTVDNLENMSKAVSKYFYQTINKCMESVRISYLMQSGPINPSRAISLLDFDITVNISFRKKMK
jgi:hypothetical protein